MMQVSETWPGDGRDIENIDLSDKPQWFLDVSAVNYREHVAAFERGVEFKLGAASHILETTLCGTTACRPTTLFG